MFNEAVWMMGDFIVQGDGGLETNDNLCTTGTLDLGVLQEPSIKVLQGKVARFNVNSCNQEE